MKYCLVSTPVGTVRIEAHEGRLNRVSLVDDPGVGKPCKDGLLFNAALQIEEYFQGERQSFDLPLNLQGTEFQKSIFKAIQNVEYAQTLSYGELAVNAGYPGAHRAAGTTCGKNQFFLLIPCHRIVAAHSIGSYPPGLDIKRFLLGLENRYK